MSYKNYVQNQISLKVNLHFKDHERLFFSQFFDKNFHKFSDCGYPYGNYTKISYQDQLVQYWYRCLLKTKANFKLFSIKRSRL